MKSGKKIASLILAAGRSSRFGSSRFAGKRITTPPGLVGTAHRDACLRPCGGRDRRAASGSANPAGVEASLKQLARIRGMNLVDLAVSRSTAAGLDPIVVLGYKWRTIRKALRNRARVVVNRRYDDGQLSSLKCALRRLSPARYAAFLIYPCDYAAVKSADISKLVARFKSGTNKDIIALSHRGRMGHPVLVSMALKDEFMSLGRRSSARDVIYKDRRRIDTISANSRRIFMDIDDLTDYHQLRRLYA